MLISIAQVSFGSEPRFGFERKYDDDHLDHAVGRRRNRQSRQENQPYFSSDGQVAGAATEKVRPGADRGGDDAGMARDRGNNDADDAGSSRKAPGAENGRKH